MAERVILSILLECGGLPPLWMTAEPPFDVGCHRLNKLKAAAPQIESGDKSPHSKRIQSNHERRVNCHTSRPFVLFASEFATVGSRIKVRSAIRARDD
jgi:hypothetical protein